MNRRPISPHSSEALYQVHVVCAPDAVAMARDRLPDVLEQHHYPIRAIEVLSEADDIVELGATLIPTTADFTELDDVIAQLQSSPGILSATWSVSALS